METVNPNSHRATLAYDSARYLQVQVPNIGRGTTYAYDCMQRVPVSVPSSQPTTTCTFATGKSVIATRSVGVVTTIAFDASGKNLVTAVPAVYSSNSSSADPEGRKVESGVAHPHPLVARCLRREEGSWRELLGIYGAVAARKVQQLVVQAGFDESYADDIASEIFLRLLEDNFARLLSFRGSSDPELRAWLVHLAHNFAIDYLSRNIRQRRRERQARKLLPLPDRSGPTEREIAALLDDLASLLPAGDFDKLRHICGLNGALGAVTMLIATVMPDVSDRTQRRWLAELYEKYGKLFQDSCTQLAQGSDQ